jgi:hypothetical protein
VKQYERTLDTNQTIETIQHKSKHQHQHKNQHQHQSKSEQKSTYSPAQTIFVTVFIGGICSILAFRCSEIEWIEQTFGMNFRDLTNPVQVQFDNLMSAPIEILGYRTFTVVAAIVGINLLVFTGHQLLKTTNFMNVHFFTSYNHIVKYRLYHTLITSAFSHASPMHLLFNMMAFVSIAPTLIQVMGEQQFITVKNKQTNKSHSISIISIQRINCF